MAGIDRQRVRRAFGNQAQEYDHHARVQKRVVARLLGQLKETGAAPRTVLDVGPGTGLLLAQLKTIYPAALLAGADLAHGMARAAGRQLGEGALLVCADAERLPFAAASFELVVSTSTYQWLATLQHAFAEAWRVLSPGGCFHFALFGDQTLYELKESYRQALLLTGSPSPDRTHRLFTADTVARSLAEAGFSQCQTFVEMEVEEHADVPALLRSLKRIGAGNAAPSAGAGLAGRRLMAAMMDIYGRNYGRDGLIPASYEVIYGSGIK